MIRRRKMAKMLGALMLLCLLVSAPVLAAPADDVAAVEAKWTEAFAKWDLDGLAALYTPDAYFFGSLPDLYRGPDGVKAYFSKLPKGVFKAAAFSDDHVTELSPDVIVTAGFVTFTREVNGQTSQLPFRISLTLVRQDGVWKIASHHASPKPN
jgi:uncharacterized protein (TIGR02246 family)